MILLEPTSEEEWGRRAISTEGTDAEGDRATMPGQGGDLDA